VQVLIRMASQKLTFNLEFWGFVFPLGVFTSATVSLAEGLASVVFSWLATVQIGALVVLWVLVAFGTAHNAFFGSLITAPCLSDIADLSYGVGCQFGGLVSARHYQRSTHLRFIRACQGCCFGFFSVDSESNNEINIG